MPKIKVGSDIVFKDGVEEVEAVITEIISENKVEVLMVDRGYYTMISPKDIIRVK